MSVLPPTLRENRRYVLFRIITPVNPTQKEVYRSMAESVTALFGDAGAAKMHPAVVWSEGEYAIARCTRGYEKSLIAALAVVTKICGEPAAFRSVATSGTILSLKKKRWSTRRQMMPRIRDICAQVRRLIIFQKRMGIDI